MDEDTRQKNIMRIVSHRDKITAVTVVFDKHFTYGWVHYAMRIDYLSSIDEDTVDRLIEIGKELRKDETEHGNSGT